jgi:hypothetical protein
MEARQTDQLPPPPGLIASLAAGFDAIANNLTVIAFPVLLDSLLWLGPHLRIRQLLQPLITNLSTLAESGSFGVEEITLAQQVWGDFSEGFNLAAALRTFPVGVSSLMSGIMPTQTPFGLPLEAEIATAPALIGWLLLLTLCGWIAGGLYFHRVARLVHKETGSGESWRSVAQTVVLSITWLMVLMMAAMPVLLIFGLLTVINPGLAQVAAFLFALVLVWLLLPVFFSPHGIFTRQQHAFASILSSFWLVRFTLPSSGLFVLSILVISHGLSLLWRVPEQSSWMTAVGILGHAFVTTSLLAASFIYYRDMHAWLQAVFERMGTEPRSARI